MGGAVSDLRHEIRDHVAIAKTYPKFLEPYLIVVQYFLNIAEQGEGLSRDKRIDEVSPIEANGNHRLFEEASTEVELLVENPHVLDVILHALNKYTTLELSPEIDPNRKWYEPPWRKEKKMQKYAEVPIDEVTRYRTAVLRTSIRVLRLMTMCLDARNRLDILGGAVLLNNIANDNPLDDFIKNDIKAIFCQMYGGENAVKRIVIGNIQVVIELMNENQSSSLIQLEGIKRLCTLVSDASLHLPSPSKKPIIPSEAPATAPSDSNTLAAAIPQQEDGNQQSHQQQEFTIIQLKIFEELEKYGAVPVVAQVLNRFNVEECIGIYVNAMRFFILTCINERFTKLAGQYGGIEGAIRLLFRARELYRLKKWEVKEVAKKKVTTLEDIKKLEFDDDDDDDDDDDSYNQDTDKNTKDSKAKEKRIAKKQMEIARKLQVNYTPIEVGQQAIWALDLLATMEYNVTVMKRDGLKFLLEEIRLDPDARELGATLIVTRKLRMIRWDEVDSAAPKPLTTPAKPHVLPFPLSPTNNHPNPVHGKENTTVPSKAGGPKKRPTGGESTTLKAVKR